MEIEIRLFATLQEYLPKGSSRYSLKLKIERENTVGDVLNKLKIPKKIPKLLFVNGKQVNEDSILQPGDVISIFPPVGGG